jgi:glycosyltransferase involved in cell wall biosynthesis
MKIGLIIYGMDRPGTGVARYTRELVRALSALKHPPELTLLLAGGAGPLQEAGLPMAKLPGCRLLPGLMTLGNILIPWQTRRLGLDAVHDPTGATPFLFGAGRAKAIVTIHDVIPLACPGTSTLLDTLIYRHWLPHALQKADAVITDSNCSKADIQRYYPIPSSDISVIPCGISSLFHPLPADEVQAFLQRRFDLSRPYILFVGALAVRKNISRLLDAFASLHREYPRIALVLAGPRSGVRFDLEAHARHLGVFDHVVITGPCSDEELCVLYNGAELLCFPSLYEGFGLPPLEAMACGTPVVCSRAGSLPEVVGDAVVFCDPYQPNTIATAMRTILEDPFRRNFLRERGKARSHSFTWQQAARATCVVYEKAVSGASAVSFPQQVTWPDLHQ